MGVLKYIFRDCRCGLGRFFGGPRLFFIVTLHSSNIHEWQLLSVVHQNKLVIAFCLRWYKKDLTTINFNLIPPICSCCIFFYINKYQKGSFFICGRTTNFLAKDEKCSRLSRKAIGE